jgi:hypothetical protein
VPGADGTDGAPAPADDARALLIRETRWAILQRLLPPSAPPGPRETAALRRSLAEMPPAPEAIDRATKALLDAVADGAIDAPEATDSARSLRALLRDASGPRD